MRQYRKNISSRYSRNFLSESFRISTETVMNIVRKVASHKQVNCYVIYSEVCLTLYMQLDFCTTSIVLFLHKQTLDSGQQTLDIIEDSSCCTLQYAYLICDAQIKYTYCSVLMYIHFLSKVCLGRNGRMHPYRKIYFTI